MFRYEIAGEPRTANGLDVLRRLLAHKSFTFEDIKWCRLLEGPEREESLDKVKAAMHDVLDVPADESLRVANEFDKWADAVRVKHQPLADLAATFGCDVTRLDEEARLGLYLNLDRAMTRQGEVMRRAMGWVNAKALPVEWCRALVDDPAAAEAFANLHSGMFVDASV